jgi:hypothetical protein
MQSPRRESPLRLPLVPSIRFISGGVPSEYMTRTVPLDRPA